MHASIILAAVLCAFIGGVSAGKWYMERQAAAPECSNVVVGTGQSLNLIVFRKGESRQLHLVNCTYDTPTSHE